MFLVENLKVLLALALVRGGYKSTRVGSGGGGDKDIVVLLRKVVVGR